MTERNDGSIICGFSHNMPDYSEVFEMLFERGRNSRTSYKERKEASKKYYKMLEDALKRDQDPAPHGQTFPEGKPTLLFRDRLANIAEEVGRKFINHRELFNKNIDKKSIEKLRKKFSKQFIVLIEWSNPQRPLYQGPRYEVIAQDPYEYDKETLGRSNISLEDCYRDVLYNFTEFAEKYRKKEIEF